MLDRRQSESTVVCIALGDVPRPMSSGLLASRLL